MRATIRLAAVLLLATACTSFQDVAPGTVVTCGTTADCPGGRVCNRSRCILPSELGSPPDLVLVDGKLAVSPPVGQAGTGFTVTVQSTKELEAAPRVILSLDTLVELPCTATAARTYDCTYTATGAERGGLGGHVTIDVRMVDLAGQEAIKNGVGGFDLDFAPPVLAARSVAPESVPLGGVLQVFFTTDEDLGATPVLVASRRLDEAGDGLHLTPVHQPGTRNWLFTHLVTAQDTSGDVAFTVDLADAVGNSTTAAAVGLARVDLDPIDVTAPAVTPARIDATGVVTVSFDSSEEAAPGTLSVTVGGRPMSCGAYAAGTPRYTCTRAMVGDELPAGAEAAQGVVVTLADAAGNRTTASGNVVFDFRPPGVAIATVAYAPPDGSTLSTVARATVGARLTATVLADEALDPAVTPSLVARTISFSFLPASSTSTSAVFQATVPAGVPDGDYVATVTWADLAGNRAATSTGVPRVRIKTSAPSLVVDQAALTFVRSPQGNAAPEPLGSYVVPAGPYFAVEPSDALTTSDTLPAGSLRLAGGGTLASVLVQTPSATPVTLGVLRPDAAGRVPRKALESPDVVTVQLVGVDDAGNCSTAIRLQNAEWVASSNRPIGASAHRVSTIPILTSARAVPAGAAIASGTEDAGADGTSLVARGSLRWIYRDPAGNQGPPGRGETAMAHDAARGRTVLFGGWAYSQDRELDDTWEWDGTTWNDLTPPPGVGPPARQSHVMAYDAARGVVVLFGGAGGLRDTWEWDGETWRDVTPAGPSPQARSGARMTFDASTGRCVLFGGSGSGGNRQDTWEWDGSAWWDVTPAGTLPPARRNHGAAYDPVRAVTYVFGGYGDTGARQDTWEWNGRTRTWRNVTPAGASPPAREALVMTYDAARGRTLMLGGYTPAPKDVWQWDGTSWTSVTPPGNVPQFGPNAGIAYDAANRVVVVFGGMRSSSSDYRQLQAWNGTSWALLSTGTAGPVWRNQFAMTFDSARHRAVVFGGQTMPPGGISSQRLDDTWEWDGAGWVDRTPASGGPVARWAHAMAYDSGRDRSVLFGGVGSGGTLLQDTWEWDGTAWTTLTPVSMPPARRFTAMAYAANRGRTVLFGGNGAAGVVQDTWEWDGTRWYGPLPSTYAPPSARSHHAMVYDATNRLVVLFGGNDGTNDLQDTWTWNGTTWRQLSPGGTLPAARSDHALAWDSERNRVLLSGSNHSTGSSVDVWEWNGSMWTSITPAGLGPTSRAFPGLAFDERRGRAVLFGGTGSEDVIVWELDTRTTRTPAVQLDAMMGSAGFRPADVLGLRVRAWAGGTPGVGGAGALLYGWAGMGTGASIPGWTLLHSNSAALGAAPPGSAVAWSVTGPTAAAEARRFVTERDRLLSFQVRPTGPAGSSVGGGAVGLDYLEVRVRYAVP